MLHVNIENQAMISLLKSDRWLFNLLSGDSHKDDYLCLAIQSLHDQMNNPERRENLELVFKSKIGAFNQIYSLDFIDFWLRRLLVWQGNRYTVNNDYLDEWLSICSQIDPAIVLGRGFAKLILNGNITPEQLIHLPQCLQAFDKEKINCYADNHSHLGGNGSHRKAFVEFSYSPYIVSCRKFHWPVLTEFSYINSRQLSASLLPRLQHSLFCFLIESLISIKNRKELKLPNVDTPSSLKNFNLSLRPLISGLSEFSTPFKLLSLVSEVNVDKATLLIWTALFYAEISYSSNEILQKFFRAFIHTSQILRAGMIHKGAGLSFFSNFFRFKARKGKSKNYDNYSIFSDLDMNVYREFKVYSEATSKNNLIKAIKKLESNGLKNNGHFCLHFKRSGCSSDKLQRMKRLELKKEVNRLSRLFSSVDAQNVLLGKESKNNQTVNVLNLVRTLDVAGNENELKIEIFAPSLRYLRSCPWKSNYPYYQPQHKLCLSVHAGEDFNHIISGLRHIDEIVEFCEFSNGDRLGHALALGIDPMGWVMKNQVTYLSAGEHLDNLIWLYHQAVELSMQLPELQSFASRLEVRAQKLVESVLNFKYDITSMYEAWRLRRNCPITYFEAKSQNRTLFNHYLPDFQKNVDRDDKATQIWRNYVMTKQLERKKTNPYERIITIRHVRSNHPDAVTDFDKGEDYFSVDEIVLINAIQDALMNKYDSKGITLEVCPSSNIYIGYFDCYSQHPIFRWNPPESSLIYDGGRFNQYGIRKGHVRVCVNTDDSGLFPTTIRNEHHVLKETAMRYFGVCREEAETWIDRIRKIGLEEFKRNHIDLN